MAAFSQAEIGGVANQLGGVRRRIRLTSA